MVMLTSSEPPGSSYNYYATRRTPFEGLHNSEVVMYSTEVLPVYSEHDSRIRGVSSKAQRTSDGYSLQDSTSDNALVERSSSLGRGGQSSNHKALARRSSSCSRAVQTSNRQLTESEEYIKHGCGRAVQPSNRHLTESEDYIKQGIGHAKEYVIEEHIPRQFYFHVPSKKTQMELMAIGDNANDGRTQSVPRIPREPELVYFGPPNSDEHWADTNQSNYYDNRRAAFAEPQETKLKYWSKIIPSDSYKPNQLRSLLVDSALDRIHSLTRERSLQNQVISEDISSRGRHAIHENEMALVPFNSSQSMPAAQSEYRSQWIKIPAGPTTITVCPTISSTDPRTWVNIREPLQITNYDSRNAFDSNHSHVVHRSATQKQKERADQKFVTYEHIPRPDTEISLEKKNIVIDQRFDRGHKDNRGSDYRSKWVRMDRGPSVHIYSSIHSRDREAMMDPGITGYVGDLNYLESKAKSENRKKSEYTRTNDSSVNRNYNVNTSTSKVNKILNTKEDFEKKHFINMLFNLQHIIKEREALGAYEMSPKMKNKMDYLTSAVHDICVQNRSRKHIDSYPTASCKNLLSFSSLLAPILPDNGRTNAISRFNYMLHGPRINVTNM